MKKNQLVFRNFSEYKKFKDNLLSKQVWSEEDFKISQELTKIDIFKLPGVYDGMYNK